jgi:hypothetical protein
MRLTIRRYFIVANRLQQEVDFLVEGIISVELKATTKLDDNSLSQAINYLEAYNFEGRAGFMGCPFN